MYDYFQNKSSIRKLIRTEHSCIPQQQGVFNTIITGVRMGGALTQSKIRRVLKRRGSERERERLFYKMATTVGRGRGESEG